MRCGYVAVLGRPNAGKSSLVNYIVGEEVAVVSKRQQTTRNNILGILTGEDYQIIFIDTPGIHHSKNSLDRFMMKNVRYAISTADVIIYLVDGSKATDEEEIDYIKMLKSKANNVFVVLSKIDKERIAKIDYDYAISVKTGENIKKLVQGVVSKLPIQEKLYEDDEYTDRSIKFLVCEQIRGYLLDKFDDELPHGIAVVCEDFSETESKVTMDITLVCNKERHKGIIIGKGGENLKKIGIFAREYAESLFDKQVVIHIFVKVDEDWLNKNINKYGY